ncbi:MAG: glycosyltransferase family 2 protein [Candidatus Omnitrophica bacterium]|nr:glycosyltransferase family 2 protein [Candidatus Omnitrophota bacterium]MDD5652651.1 glycosyltransferase family 2 protein [Candidatus Omnitrophota bacterium]
MPLLSVIVPVYNEANTIKTILEKIEGIALDKEIIVVDDGSIDDSRNILRQLKYDNLKVIHHSSNRGKGSAVATGLSQASGEFVIIQDADLEYDPQDYLRLLEKIKENSADIILGARFTKGYHGLLVPRIGNRLVTGLMNLLFLQNLNDCLTCYKLFRGQTVSGLHLTARGFDIEIEIIAKAIKKHLRIDEVPISYLPRSYKEGKKIRWKDGIWAMLSIIKYRFS